MLKVITPAVLLAAACVPAITPALAAEARREGFGRMPDGAAVEAVTLTNAKGMSVRVMTLGASIQSVMVPGRDGKTIDVAVGYDSLEGYSKAPEFFGATVGRVANRIAKGRFTLDGKGYTVPVNNGVNSLHGGTKGFDKVIWTVRAVKSGKTASVTMRYVSPDGDMGYPGTLTTDATYSLDEQNRLTITYTATTDKPTVVNISNHAYWNLAGPGRTAMDHLLTIPADRFTPTDETSIPLGEHRSVEGTAFDFRKPTPVGARVRDGSDAQIVYGRGYDHNWVVGDAVTADEHLMARVVEPTSGRGFELWSNQPGLQFYSGNFMDGTITGKSGHIYREGDVLVFEPQLFPDSPNQPRFPSIRLAPGKTYRNVMTYKFFVTPE
ncbi:aldose 1-epimerase [Sphingomonas sp. LH128]|jgi:aldose 1-epimerase|uniref:Aldose 1-epimerase n=1 Tax=Novosphingobium resinovorum TaxID=158500 RepID=A0A031J6F1_9SPHN|nr:MULTISPECIES: aldose epimerase family protein [Sphingomonadaceae]AOR79397.1 galactose mutarotase [Novosphingobium resinovorum]EJU10999.1 aldose 1-epimerase [Sphingomonas sp. LH128]EZP68295.1 Aldose 1-epimerase [Novosphingobium resinovorum]